MKPVHRRWLSLALTTTVWSLAARAAESPQPTPPHFGCYESTESSVGSGTDYKFEPTTVDALNAERALPAPAVRIGPFSLDRFRFRRLEFFVDAVPITTPGLTAGGSVPATLRLVVHAIGDPVDEWWRVTSRDRARLQAPQSEPRLNAPQRAASQDLPLFLFSWGHYSQGTGASCEWTEHLILDFRPEVPRVAAMVQCGECDYYGGSAQAWNKYERQAFDCRWEAPAADFLCTHTTWVPLDWSERAYMGEFLLLAGDTGPGPVDPAQPADLGELARNLAAGTAPLGVTASVPVYGPVVPLLALPAPSGVSARYLIGALGHDDDFDARFIVVTLRSRGSAVVSEVPASRVDDDLEPVSSGEARCPASQAVCTPLGPAPSFQVSKVGRGPEELTVVKVVVRDGDARGVFLVGVQEQSGRLVTGSLRLATDAMYFRPLGCLYPTQIIPIEEQLSPFRISAEIEPARFGYLEVRPGQPIESGYFEPATTDDESGTDLAPRYAVYWAGASGFVLEPLGQAVAVRRPPRFVAIDASGHVTLHTPQRR